MTEKFDMQKAREICERIKGYEDPDAGNGADFAAAMKLPAALDRIGELERSLCEAEARSLLNFQRFEAAMEGELMWARTHDWDACHEDEQKDRIDFARRGLKAEGKL